VCGDTHACARRYVCTAPDGDTILSSEDLVYVVAERDWARAQLGLAETPSWRKDLREYWVEGAECDGSHVSGAENGTRGGVSAELEAVRTFDHNNVLQV